MLLHPLAAIDLANVLQLAGTRQWFSALLRLWPFDTVAHVAVTTPQAKKITFVVAS